MRVLITSSRMPFALDEIRKFGDQGHEVYASDTFANAPGSHSKYVAEALLTASPRYQPAQFIADLHDIVESKNIDVIVPCFEEVFYIANSLADFSLETSVFASPLSTLADLHDKVAFLEMARELGLSVPRTITVTDREELRSAARELTEYFARPSYSRGGVELLTNTGPLAGALSIDECQPSPENPWLVQEFVHGLDVCSFSVAHRGRIAAHSSYVHPREIEHAGGIVFESVVEPETLRLTERVVAATRYTGQISIDFLKTDRGFFVVECNPRPTAGVMVMPPQMFVDSVLNPVPSVPRVAEAGVRRKMSVALIRDMVLHWKEIPADLEALFSRAKDVYAQSGDLLPALYQLLSYSHVTQYRRQLHTGKHKRTDLMAAYFYDIAWNGEPIPEPGPSRAFAARA